MIHNEGREGGGGEAHAAPPTARKSHCCGRKPPSLLPLDPHHQCFHSISVPPLTHQHEKLKVGAAPSVTLCKEFHGGSRHWLKPVLWWYIQVFLRGNLPKGDGLTRGRMLQGSCRFRILQLFTHSNLPLDQHRLRDHNFKLGLFSRKRLAKNWKKHAFDAGSTGSWLVAAFQGAVTIVRVIFSTVSPGLSPPQLLTDSTKN